MPTRAAINDAIRVLAFAKMDGDITMGQIRRDISLAVAYARDQQRATKRLKTEGKRITAQNMADELDI